MNMRINKSIPLSIKEQLKRQIRGMVRSGQLHPGEALPASKDLAKILSVNRNTVAAVYQELISEGVLYGVRGAGTFVHKSSTGQMDAVLTAILKPAVLQALQSGYSADEITDLVLTTLAERTADRKKRVLLVWCNQMTLKELSQTLEQKLGVETECVSLDLFKSDPGQARAKVMGKDLVVTSLNYLEQLKPVTDTCGVEVTGVILMSVTRVINEMIHLPAGSTVGFSCVNDVASESTCRYVRISGGTTLKTIWAGADDEQKVKQMAARCDMVFATHHVFEQIRRLTPEPKPVIKINCSINDASIALIRERLNHRRFKQGEDHV